MDMTTDARTIINESIRAVLPDKAVTKALAANPPPDATIVIAIGKAAWRMAKAARDTLGGDKISRGLVITKYNHSNGKIPGFEIIEAGHPIPDENSIRAAERALEMVRGLDVGSVLLLLSGGGSALFEKPLANITLSDVQRVTDALLRTGADIGEINTIRKRLSSVKGGRFALACAPARVRTIALSDVLTDAPDVIASGPAWADASTSEQARAIIRRAGIDIPHAVKDALSFETPKSLGNVTFEIIGSVGLLCDAAACSAARLGYAPMILTTRMNAEARESGSVLASIAREIRVSGHPIKPPCCVIMGGESIVNVRGSGKGGRNQELALSAARNISGLENVVVFSVGSDGTDGPTDAAGGIVDGGFAGRCLEAGLSISDSLDDNDAYTLLEKMGGLVVTGPTGTNVNDVAVAMLR